MASTAWPNRFAGNVSYIERFLKVEEKNCSQNALGYPWRCKNLLLWRSSFNATGSLARFEREKKHFFCYEKNDLAYNNVVAVN
jgi:hypothetical protein